LAPALSGSIFFHPTVHGNCHKSVARNILKLDNLMAGPSKLTPPARLVGILFDSYKLPTLHREIQDP
jgi:hypothetical protein